MSSILLPRRFYSQPSGGVMLSGEYASCLAGIVGRQSITKKQWSVSGSPSAITWGNGRGFNYSQSQQTNSTPGNYLYLPNSSAEAYTGSLTAIANFRLLPQQENLGVANRGIISKFQGLGSITNHRSWALSVDYQTANDGSTAYASLIVSPDGTSASAVVTPRNANTRIYENTVVTVVGVYRKSTAVEIYVSGAGEGKTTTSIPSASYAGSAPIVVGSLYAFGSTTDSWYTLTCEMGLAAVFPFAVSGEVARCLVANPWSIFKAAE